MHKSASLLIITIILSCIQLSCSKKSDPGPGSVDCTDVNIYSLDIDRQYGMQADSQIRATPNEFPILDSAKYSTAYGFLYKIRDNILKSGEVEHEKDFPWKIAIIHNDTTLNAFCTPGGYIYVYTGIIKYLDNEDQLAGVLGHEIGHAANRHSTKSISKQVGITTLEQLLLGKDPSTLVNVVNSLITLKYTRCQEAQADEYSVIYLAKTQYKCNGAAGFFVKLESSGQGSQTPEFLSDHPGDASRIANINLKANTLHCDTTSRVSTSGYAAFKASLP